MKTRNPSIRRIMSEWKELNKNKSSRIHAQPLEDDLFEWHFTIRGPRDTEFQDGLYHGRILLPHNYPLKPPSIIFLTPNGRFDLGMKICLTASNYHPETWRAAWSIRTVLTAIIGFMPSPAGGAIGGLDYSVERRTKMALESKQWKCSSCDKCNHEILPDIEEGEEEHTEIDLDDLSTSVSQVVEDNKRFPMDQIRIQKIVAQDAEEGDSSEEKEKEKPSTVDNDNNNAEEEKSNNNNNQVEEQNQEVEEQNQNVNANEEVVENNLIKGADAALRKVMDSSIALVFFCLLWLVVQKFVITKAPEVI